MMKFNCFWIDLLLIIILSVPYSVNASLKITKIPDRGYCADEHCLTPILSGTTTVSYISVDEHVLSCKSHSEITIYSTSENKKLFPLAEINGKRGFFPPRLFRVDKKKVNTEKVNVPVQFILSDKNVVVVKALPNETSISSSIDSNTTSIQESLVIPSIPLEEQGNKGFIFAHASAAKASESHSTDYAPGHSPEFPSLKEVDVTQHSSTVLQSSPVDSPVDPAAQVDASSPAAKIEISKEAGSKSKDDETKGPTDGESSSDSTENISAGTEEDYDDDDDEDDEEIAIESEHTDDHSPPHVASLQASINDKTETLDMVSSTAQTLHPSTSPEGSAKSETVVRTSPVPSSGLPHLSSSKPPAPPDIQSSKPVIPEIAASDSVTLTPKVELKVNSDQKQEETATSESPQSSGETAAMQSSSESSTVPQTSVNLSGANVNGSETGSSPGESGYRDGFNVASTQAAENVGSNVSGTVFNQTSDSSTSEKFDSALEPETTVTTENASLSGENGGAGMSKSGTEEVVQQNETVGASEEARPAESSEQNQQPSPLSTNTSSSTNNETDSLGSPPQETPEKIPNQDQTYNYYRPPIAGAGQQPVAQLPLFQQPAVQPNVAQPSYQQYDQPPADYQSVAGQLPTGYPADQSVAGQLPRGHPADQSVAGQLPRGHPADQSVAGQLPTGYPADQSIAGQLPRGQDQSVAVQLPTGHPADETPQADLPFVTQSPIPPGMPPVNPADLYESLSLTAPAHSAEPGEPSTVEPSTEAPLPYTPPADIGTTTEEYETFTAPSITREDQYKAPEQVQDFSQEAESTPSFFDSFLSYFSWSTSSESPVDSPPADVPTPEPAVQPDQLSSYPGYAPQQEVPPKASAQITTCPDGSVGPDCAQESFLILPFQLDGLGVDSLMTRIIAAGVTLLLCIIAYFFLQNRRMDGSLVARVNTLERELMVLSKENTLLKEECASNINQGQLEVVLLELEETKAAKADLEEQVATLERDLDEAAEANMELNQMLAQTLENPKGSADDVLASVERLQAQLDGQRDTIGNMTRSLSSKNAEIESLKAQLTECRETISGLEAEVTTLSETVANVRREKEDANIAHVEKLQDVQNHLAEALANKVLEESRLGSELSSVKLNLKKTRQIVVAKESEVEVLKESFKELKSKGISEENLAKFFDAVKLNAQVEQLTQERDELEESLRGEGDARKRLEDHVRVIEEEVNKLRVNYEEAQKEKSEAQTRLEVLSNYFKEKEAQLKKELDLQEILLAQQRGDENSVLRQVKSLQEEVETYRSQNESLKREILDQERDLKGQLATLEKKSHDNWVSARQAERKLEEARQEASQLRNRLTIVEKNLSSSGEAGGVEANGEGGVVSPVLGLPGMGPMGALMGPMGPMIPPPPPIDLDSTSGLPPFMFPPLSPGALPSHSHPHFIPPLPPPLLAGDRRPPPLGRMSSPPPAPPPPPGHFSPPPPHFDRLDRPSQSPSPTYHRSPAGGERQGFRPFAKPSPRKPTDYRGSNISSGQSNEPTEKTRTNERV